MDGSNGAIYNEMPIDSIEKTFLSRIMTSVSSLCILLVLELDVADGEEKHKSSNIYAHQRL